MPRKKRVWYEDSQLHITSRGNRRNDIFREEKDYEIYLRVIEEALDHFEGRFSVLSYCLMTNHVHLQVQTSTIHITEFVHRINSLYAMKFNAKYQCTGHLFQGRYGSELIESDPYVLVASSYIHLNPVKANMVKKPEQYKWSSYSMVIGKRKERIIDSDRILNYFTSNDKRRSYKEFVENHWRYMKSIAATEAEVL